MLSGWMDGWVHTSPKLQKLLAGERVDGGILFLIFRLGMTRGSIQRCIQRSPVRERVESRQKYSICTLRRCPLI